MSSYSIAIILACSVCFVAGYAVAVLEERYYNKLLSRNTPKKNKMADTFKENGWRFNNDTYCCACNKLRYMGYTTFTTNYMCVCNDADSIATYVDKDRLPKLLKEFKR